MTSGGASRNRSAFATTADAPGALRIRNGRAVPRTETVAAEVPVALSFNGADHAVMLATPADLEDFATGFCLTEGIVACASEILSVVCVDMGTGLKIEIALPDARATALRGRERLLPGRTGCGLCGISSLEQVLRALPQVPEAPPLAASAIMAAQGALAERQSLNRATGAAHAAAFADRQGTVLVVREDIGRHNALDKLVGALLREGLDPGSGFVLVTSRCSMEMAQKAIVAGFPLIAAISAPTSLALAIAKSSGLALAGFVREAGFTLYTHAERVSLPL